MLIRRAERDDLLGIGRVAATAHWASYETLLRPETIGRLLQRGFSPAVVRRRLIHGGIFVATANGDVVGFIDGTVGEEAVHVESMATAPPHRRLGIATALLKALRGLSTELPTWADVLLGNLEGEQFYEANGFVPGEVRHLALFGEDVVERRWWVEAVVERPAGGIASAG